MGAKIRRRAIERQAEAQKDSPPLKILPGVLMIGSRIQEIILRVKQILFNESDGSFEKTNDRPARSFLAEI